MIDNYYYSWIIVKDLYRIREYWSGYKDWYCKVTRHARQFGNYNAAEVCLKQMTSMYEDEKRAEIVLYRRTSVGELYLASEADIQAVLHKERLGKNRFE